LVNCSQYLVEATRDQRFDVLECLRESSGAGRVVEGAEMGFMPVNGGGECGYTPKDLFEL
jgi:hypothetical protein